MEVFIIKLTNENIELKLGSEKKTRHGILCISKDLSKPLKQQFPPEPYQDLTATSFNY